MKKKEKKEQVEAIKESKEMMTRKKTFKYLKKADKIFEREQQALN